MTYKSLFNFIKHLALVGILSSISVTANAYDFSPGVFEFQQKLAKKGNPQSQYKLGNMYENGQGVKVNLDEAAKWYKKSAAQNNQAAKMRFTYIDIKKNGYNKAKHNSWLKKLQKDAAAKDGESLLLLASMHKKGFIVKKDLNKSAKLFKSASIRNVPGAEAELEAVNVLIYNQQDKQKKANAEKKAQREKAKKEQAKIDKAKREKQLTKDRKKAAEQRKRQQAAQQRARTSEQDRKAAEKRLEKIKLEQAKREQAKAKQEEQRKAAEQAKTQKTEDEATESDPLVDKSMCKGKKARFLTMCR